MSKKKLEKTSISTVVSYSNSKSKAVIINSNEKRKLQKYFRTIEKRRVYIYHCFAINRQEELLTSLVKDILGKIEEKEKEHIKKFSDDSLEDSLSSCGYFISKLWPFERERIYSESCFRMLSKTYDSFKDKIKQRYGYDSLEFQPGLKMEIEKVDKLLPRIEKMIPMDGNVDEFDLEVYVESLQNAFDELKIMAKETDIKFGYYEKEKESK